MVEVSDLEKIDYEILKFLNNHGRVSEGTLLKHFSEDKDVVKLRIKLLSTPEYEDFHSIPCTSYINKIYEDYTDKHGLTHTHRTDLYEINSFGKKVLNDYIERNKAKNKEYWIRSVIVPFIVSLVTAVVTTIATLSIAKHLEPYL